MKKRPLAQEVFDMLAGLGPTGIIYLDEDAYDPHARTAVIMSAERYAEIDPAPKQHVPSQHVNAKLHR